VGGGEVLVKAHEEIRSTKIEMSSVAGSGCSRGVTHFKSFQISRSNAKSAII
jgi:hypothetical protein